MERAQTISAQARVGYGPKRSEIFTSQRDLERLAKEGKSPVGESEYK